MKYRYFTGETISLFLRASAEEMAPVTSIFASIKKTGPNGFIPTGTTPPEASFVIETRADGWMLSAPPLPVGSYVTNASLSLNGVIVKTDPCFFEVVQSVS